jgi:hypothetical protein
VSTGTAAVVRGVRHALPRIDAALHRAYPWTVTDYALEHCVPVSARLSKRFYDVLGEDVANELVTTLLGVASLLVDRN